MAKWVEICRSTFSTDRYNQLNSVCVSFWAFKFSPFHYCLNHHTAIMDKQPKFPPLPPKPPRDKESKKTPPPPNNGNMTFLAALIAISIIAAIVFVNHNGNKMPLTYSHLWQLITAKPDDKGVRSITYKESEGREFRISSPTEIELATSEITGKVSVESLSGPNANGAAEVVSFETSRGPLDDSSGKLPDALRKADIDFKYSSGPGFLKTYFPVLLITSLLVLGFFYLARKLGGASSPMAFGRSRGKMYAQEDLEISFDDVAGIEEAVDELREVVEFLKTPEKYQILGGRIPKGVLLVGPPGTGKTLLAKAIAGEADVPFFSLSGSDFVEMFVGVGAARVRDMFHQAEMKAPCIIFIDELDALGKTRGTSIVGGNDEREQTLNALLVEMDGFGSNSGVIVIAATNRPETLDPALLRPGRFDRQVLVDRPDIRGREDILKVHVGHIKIDPAVSLKEVARITSGFVGADLANLVNEAALLAARKNKTMVGMAEFNEGVERVSIGLEKKQRIMNEEEKLRVAYHESGHALVGYCLPNTDPVHKVSIIPRGIAALGYTMHRPDEERFLTTHAELESRIQVLLAGTLTEELIYDDVSTGAQNDLERASEIARSMVMDFGMSRLGRVNYRQSGRSPFLAGGGMDFGPTRTHSEQTAREIDEEVKRILDEMIEKVKHILSARRPALEALTKRLMEKEVVEAIELRQLMEDNSPGPHLVPGTTTERKRNVPIVRPEPASIPTVVPGEVAEG